MIIEGNISSRNNQQTIRKILLDEIKKEVFGPREKEEVFESSENLRTRYFSGVLYPIQTPFSEDDVIASDSESFQDSDAENEDIGEKISINVGTKPSSMGLTCHVSTGQKFVIARISYAKYLEHVSTDSVDKTPHDVDSDVGNHKGMTSPKPTTSKYPDWKRLGHVKYVTIDLTKTEDKEELEPNTFFRYWIQDKRDYLVLNAFLTNERKYIGGKMILNNECVFQPEIILSSIDSSKIFNNIKNEKEQTVKRTSSEREQEFLFRNYKNFAQGRSCSVEWRLDEDMDATNWIKTTFVPVYTIPEIKPRQPPPEIKKLLNMRHLSKITNMADYRHILEPLIVNYGKWINKLESNPELNGSCHNTMQGRIDECNDALTRIKNGIEIISTDCVAAEAFRFTNEVMYQNILHTQWSKDNKEKISRGESISSNEPMFHVEPEWRLFQLAFLLLSIKSITNPTSEERKTVDLLWFPTGSGKTEAYFGVITFLLAHRRLKGSGTKKIEEELDRYGISIIMRYTYRLLTLQQFQRAATLFCACEYVRMKNPSNRKKFGDQPFLVGLWVGNSTTPNSYSEAMDIIKKKRQAPNMKPPNGDPIQLLNCPWCGREIDAYNYKYEKTNGKTPQPERIWIRCDKNCFFGKPNDPDHVLPVVFIDDDIRNLRPSLLISTVDKFAQISWNCEYSKLFGIVSQYCKKHGYAPRNVPNDKTCSCKENRIKVGRNLAPPELIIQDELHLITGPLGTLTGLYETVIDILCTNNKEIRPKIIASTATAQRGDVQIQNLFNSVSTKIFPPQGFEFGNSYFAQVFPVNMKTPGKLHVGICSTSVSGYNVDSRVAACVLRKIRHIMENKEKYYFQGEYYSFSELDLDPYYTLVSYYNTIKNLGAAVRMFEDTIPTYMNTIINTKERIFQLENNAPKKNTTNLVKEELTGRVDAKKIPKILQNIETPMKNEGVCDALLCTNMLSVGVDVSRLGLMVINGQPKSTSEYIQASGRIGRTSPGIVITNYTYIKPRDLSYFENFVEFHSTYHKSVESGSITPFSHRARDRGLSGVLIALIRLTDKFVSTDPTRFNSDDQNIKDIVDKIVKRVDSIDPSETDGVKADLNNLGKKWDSIITECKNQSELTVLKYRRNPHPNAKNKSKEQYLLQSSRDPHSEQAFIIPESLRDAESEIGLYYAENYDDA